MRELTVNEQEAIDGGGWNWWDVLAGACDVCAGATIADPFASAGFDILGGICSIMGSQN